MRPDFFFIGLIMDASSQQAIYQCHAFHDSLPGGKASGQLSLDSEGLSYRVGELGGRLPFNQLQFSLGGASNRLVFIKHPAVGSLTLYTSDLSILKHPALQAHPEVAPQLLRARQQRHIAWGVLVGVGLLIIAIPVLLAWNMEMFTGIAARQVPISWETKLGESVSAQYRISHTLMPREKSDVLLKPLVSQLTAALPKSPYQYQFTIVNDATLNAFALPGGFVTINSGLILKAESAEELLGVLAHEISHVEERHGVRSIVNNAGIYMLASALLGDVSGLLASVSTAAPMLLSQQYSRRFETDADEKAAMLMERAHIDPEGLPRFFEKMIAEEKAMLDKIESEEARTAYKTAMVFLSTHPASEERMKHLRELTKHHEDNYIQLNTEFKALQEAVKTFVASNKPLEETTSETKTIETEGEKQ
jgi:beta-barrel assembly-enhancing protease